MHAAINYIRKGHIEITEEFLVRVPCGNWLPLKSFKFMNLGDDMGNPCIIMDTSYLFKIPKDREYYENLADLYSIFMAMENLEKAYIRDIISADE